MTQLKESYSINEWKQREQYYIQQCQSIIIPPEPTTKDVMQITSKIDTLLSEALFDLSHIKRNLSLYKNKMNLAEKEAFVICKQQQIAQSNKVTENEVKGLVVQYLKTHPLDNGKYSIYVLMQNTEYRYTFIESVVNILTEKKGSLISDSAMMKIESSLNQNNVGVK